MDPITAARLAAVRVKARRRVAKRRVLPFEATWQQWIAEVFPQFAEFAPHHVDFWEWVWSIQPGVRPEPFVGIWPRGGAKSSSAELAAVALLARGVRRYCLYSSGSQNQAEKHLDAIEALLLSPKIAEHYPQLAERSVNKFSYAAGWNGKRIVTAAGVVIEALGLYSGTRGLRWEEQRPDLIVLDDVDELDDARNTDRTVKKIETFTKTLLPAGSNDLATIAIQNLIIPDGVFARMAPGHHEPAMYLADRITSGPIPAIRGFEYEIRDGRAYITAGEPTWVGQPLDVCQAQINDWTIDGFLAEAQHQPRARGTKIYRREWWDNRNRFDLSDDTLARRAVARFMSWDTAESTSEAAAYSAVVVGDLIPYRDNHALLIRLVWRARLDFPDLLDAIQVIGEKWGFDNPPRNIQRDLIYIEYASSGRQAVQTIRRTSPHQWLKEKVIEHRVTLGKDDRGHLAAAYCRAGRVWLPDSTMDAPWLGVFQDELFSVPNAPHRDVTDAFSQLVINVRDYLTEPVQMRQEAT